MAEHRVSLCPLWGLLCDQADEQKFSRKRIAQKVLAEEITELVHGRMFCSLLSTSRFSHSHVSSTLSLISIYSDHEKSGKGAKTDVQAGGSKKPNY